MNRIFLTLFLSLISISATGQSNILFSRSSGELNSGETPDLMVYNPIHKTTKLLLKGSVSGRGEYNVATSSDNSKIVFNTYRYGGWKLGIADFDGDNITNIERLTSRSNYEYNAKYSPDGKRIVYQEFNWGTNEVDIFIADKNGRNAIQFTTAKGGDRNPDWTRDNKHIVFTSGRDLSYNIYIKPVDGSSTKKLTSNWATNFAPSTSKASDKIAFLSDRKGRVNLYVMDLDGSNLTNLTPKLKSDFFKAIRFSSSGYWAYKTSWSPNGKQIVFNAMKDGNLELFIVNSDGTVLTQITDNNDSDISPFWIN